MLTHFQQYLPWQDPDNQQCADARGARTTLSIRGSISTLFNNVLIRWYEGFAVAHDVIYIPKGTAACCAWQSQLYSHCEAVNRYSFTTIWYSRYASAANAIPSHNINQKIALT